MSDLDGVQLAIKCGPVPDLRNLDLLYDLDPGMLTLGEQVIQFAHMHLITPEGIHVGKPLRLDPFQQAFLLAVIDNPAHTRTAILSMARRNGKTFLIAVLTLAFLIGPLAGKNEGLASAATSRDQAALLFSLMSKMIYMSPDLEKLLRVTPSGKRITSIPTGSEYYAMSADAKTGFGRALRLVVLDEAGQITGPNSTYVDMLRTSQGSSSHPLFVTISTQAPSDADYLSIQIDHAIRHQPANSVVHVYEAEEDCSLLDREQWKRANPGLGSFRSEEDLEELLTRAEQLPSLESGARNLLLNQRVAQVSLWLAPTPWRECGGPIDLSLFRDGRRVSLGLDLSARTDLTAAVLAAADDDGVVHLLPFVFCPTEGIEARTLRDRTPYADWVREGHLVPIGGASMDYQQIIQYLREELDRLRIQVDVLSFDRYRIEDFRARAEEEDFALDAEWVEHGQGFVGFSPSMTDFEALLLDGKIRHGNHPLLTLGASNAIVVKNPVGDQKMDKSKSTNRIDPLVAAVMAVRPVSDGFRADGPSVYETSSMEAII